MCRFLRSRASAARLPAQSVSQSAGAKSSPVLGWFVGLGVAVGTAVGTAVGAAVGVAVGSAVGVAVGSAVGVAVGSAVGVAVGSGVGVNSGTAMVKVFFMPSLAKDTEDREWLAAMSLPALSCERKFMEPVTAVTL